MHPAIQILDPIYKAETLGEARDKLGKVLELSDPAATTVTLRVLADPAFAEKLVSVRKFPAWRDQLLSDPKNAAFELPDPPLSESEESARPVLSTVALIKKSSKALLRWGASGFKTADTEVVEKRKAACLNCDQLVESPNSVPYQITRTFAGTDRRICAACGCVVSKKVLMATENCPLADIADPSLTRWGEVRIDPDR